ncbi:MAG: ribose 5-phosphate isomerase B [Candidatus Omnitrophica bacterium]|nr:ribose 5-phosphate isomerase B [Candidatus Omnitrophota bacterium]
MRYKIFIAADHRGVALKTKIGEHLFRQGHEVADLGSHDEDCPCDYPKFSFLVANNVSGDPKARGILICMTGIGHSIAANKVPGAYAALCYNKEAAILSRQHNNSNILVLGAKFVSEKEMFRIIDAWLAAEFEGGRHLRRTKQIKDMEKKLFKPFKPVRVA